MTIFVYYGKPDNLIEYSSREIAEELVKATLQGQGDTEEEMSLKGITVIEGVKLETSLTFKLSVPGGE